jgi:hypothetical protein
MLKPHVYLQSWLISVLLKIGMRDSGRKATEAVFNGEVSYPSHHGGLVIRGLLGT